MAPSRKFERSYADYTPSDPNANTSILDLMGGFADANELREYRLLAPKSGLRVSPICLGSMSIGDQWSGYMKSSMNFDQAAEYLDTFYKMGGNFIDTAGGYQDEQAEVIVGEWMEKRGIRDEMVIAGKYGAPYVCRVGERFPGIQANYIGNNKKNLKHCLESTLQKLRTDYIDIFYVHWWDYSSPIEEVMQALHELVLSGKILYLGISDTPAWIVSQANEYARSHGLTPFVVYQGSWNLSARDMERDIVPMCRANGMGIAPWGVFGGGLFKSLKEIEARGGALRGGAQATEEQLTVIKALEEVANEIKEGTHLTHVAMAWIRQQYPYTFPILGGTNIDHLKSNVEALKIVLSTEQLEKLNTASPFNPGFPWAFFGTDPHQLPGGKPNSFQLNATAAVKFVNTP